MIGIGQLYMYLPGWSGSQAICTAHKPSALLDKADIIHTTHDQGPECGRSKCTIMADKEMSQEMQFLAENLDFHRW